MRFSKMADSVIASESKAFLDSEVVYESCAWLARNSRIACKPNF
ncbi:hypothetical protein [uncultured Helicobacter sp.]